MRCLGAADGLEELLALVACVQGIGKAPQLLEVRLPMRSGSGGGGRGEGGSSRPGARVRVR
jgi:hypothetical protein